ncbi:hypothetical protein [Pedobacter sp.]
MDNVLLNLMTYGQQEKRTANKVLPKVGMNGFDWTFVQGSSFVLQLNFCAENPAFGNINPVNGQAKNCTASIEQQG